LQVDQLKPPRLSNQIRSALADVKIEPTPEEPALSENWGEEGLSAAERLYAWNTLEVLASSLRKGWESELTLVVDSAYPRARLLGIIADLQVSCPSTQIQLADVVLSGAEQAIIEGSADVVVTSRVPPGFFSDWLLDVAFIAVARRDHALFAIERELTADDLVTHVQAVVRDSGTSQPRDEGWLGAERRFTVSSMEASLATILAGLAYAWLPEHLIQDQLRSGALRRLPLLTGGSRNVSLHMVAARPELLGPAGRIAMDAFRGRTGPTSGDTAA